MSIQYIKTKTHSLSEKQKKFLFILQAWLHIQDNHDISDTNTQQLINKISTITTYNIYRESDKEWLNQLRDLWMSSKTHYPPFDDWVMKYKTTNN